MARLSHIVLSADIYAVRSCNQNIQDTGSLCAATIDALDDLHAIYKKMLVSVLSDLISPNTGQFRQHVPMAVLAEYTMTWSGRSVAS